MQNTKSIAVVLLLATSASALQTASAKSRLKSLFAGRPNDALACPTSKSALRLEVTRLGDQVRRALVSDGFRYPVTNDVYLDLLPRGQGSQTIGPDALRDEIFSVFSMQTGIFRTPAMAFLYERGWRQNFDAMGFPGIDKEFEEVQEYFASVAEGGTVVDISCGTGLMARRLVASQRFERVLALDYSESMLRETDRRFVDEGIPREQLVLVRADAAELPLGSASVDAIHAGAALHCWPRLELSLSEVRRSLKPGGRFYASTFFESAMGSAQMQGPGNGSMRFFKDESELRELLMGAGFLPERIEVRREGRACAIIRAEAQ